MCSSLLNIENSQTDFETTYSTGIYEIDHTLRNEAILNFQKFSNWNRALSLDNSKILGIINLSNDSFSGDGVFNKDAKLNKLLNSAKQKNINFIDVGCASTKPGFDSVTTKEEIKRLNYFIIINVALI